MGLIKRLACHCGASRQQITSSPSAPSIVHQMVSMAWLMFMQVQPLVSGFSASSQRSNYFFPGFTRKKKKKKWRLLREWFRLWPWWLHWQISVPTAVIGPAIPLITDTCLSFCISCSWYGLQSDMLMIAVCCGEWLVSSYENFLQWRLDSPSTYSPS